MYAMYQAVSDAFLKLVRDSHRTIGKRDYIKSAQIVLERSRQFQYTLDFLIMCDELRYRETKGTCYFINDQISFDTINKVTLQSQLDLAPFITENQSFTIAFPSDLQLPSVLVTIDSDAGRFKYVNKLAGKYTDRTFINLLSDRVVVSVSYKVNNSYIRVTIPLEDCNTVVHAKDGDQLDKILPLSPALQAQQLTAAELDQQLKLLRFVFKFILFRQVADERFVDGCPTHQPKPKIYRDSKPITFSIPTIVRDGVPIAAEKYILPHIRQLMDQRYYRGKYAHLKPGSRIILVDEYVINKSTDDYQTVL